MKHKYRLFSHEGNQQWEINYWETYAPLANLIIVRSLLAMASINEFLIRSIEFVLEFTQVDLDGDVFMDIPL